MAGNQEKSPGFPEKNLTGKIINDVVVRIYDQAKTKRMIDEISGFVSDLPE